MERIQVLDHSPLLTGHYRWRGRRQAAPAAGEADLHPHTGRRAGVKFLARPAGSDDWHLILTLRGKGLVGVADAQVPVPPRRIVLWRPGTPQSYTVAPDAAGWERLWVHVRPPADWFDLLAWPEVEPGLMAVDLPPAVAVAVRAALRDCIGHDHGREPDRVRFAMNRLELALLLVARHAGRTRPQQDPRIVRLIALITADLRRDWPIDAMAAALEVSRAQVVRLCARHLGESPHRLLERLRLQEACRLLAGDDGPVARVAAGVGFSDVSHFTRRFRARFALAPAQWRRDHRAGTLTSRPDEEHIAGRPA